MPDSKSISVANSPSIIPASVDPEAYYEIKLARPVIYGGRQHSPMHRVIIKGIAWPAFKDDAISATKLSRGDEGRL